EWVHVQLHQQKGMISLSPPTICNSALYLGAITDTKRHIRIKIQQLAICNYFQEVTPPTPVQNKSSPGDKNGDNYADGD
ncbi:hypothetical protein, partial [Escherichia coli]|uniref:hypothetical protein n=1 Tax=Escherichia coli TaxID=562 RepID=UPI001F245094